MVSGAFFPELPESQAWLESGGSFHRYGSIDTSSLESGASGLGHPVGTSLLPSAPAELAAPIAGEDEDACDKEYSRCN